MLDFEQIEDCFPEGGALCAVDGRVTVSAQWLHDFAHAVAGKEREACAKVCDLVREENCYEGSQAGDCADRIRMRSNAQSHRTSRASGEGPVD